MVGYDDIQLSAFTMPPLTTVRLPRAEIANAAFHALLNAKQNNGSAPLQGEEHMVLPNLVARKSTGPAPK